MDDSKDYGPPQFLVQDLPQPANVVSFDVDGDGDLDLLTTALGGPNALFENDGTGIFADEGVTRGFADNGSAAGIAVGDLDGDGDLDFITTSGVHLQDSRGVFSSFRMPYSVVSLKSCKSILHS